MGTVIGFTYFLQQEGRRIEHQSEEARHHRTRSCLILCVDLGFLPFKSSRQRSGAGIG
ncbi:hypothetical protein D3C78_1661600 [compost metagenome]